MHELQKYRLSLNLQNTFNVSDLLDDEYLKSFMGKLALSIDAPSEKIAASIFMKRYAFLAVISLYTMTVWNKKIDVALENVEMEVAVPGKDWLPMFSIKNKTFENLNGHDRDKWRRIILKDLFAKNINPLINQLEKTFNISKLILWENIAVYIFWLYETELKANEDFHFLVFEAEGELFGSYKRNPLQKYFTEKNSEGIRIRNTCCFSYQLLAGKHCKTCPCSLNVKDGRCINGEGICSAV